jgi:hypothetical protein
MPYHRHGLWGIIIIAFLTGLAAFGSFSTAMAQPMANQIEETIAVPTAETIEDDLEDDLLSPPDFEPQPIAIIQTLDKVTGVTRRQEIPVGKAVPLGPLYAMIKSCQKTPPDDPPEAAAFVQVWESVLSAENPDPSSAETRWVFSGWMFASSPALSAMDHPVYDVWVIDCYDPVRRAALEAEQIPAPVAPSAVPDPIKTPDQGYDPSADSE